MNHLVTFLAFSLILTGVTTLSMWAILNLLGMPKGLYSLIGFLFFAQLLGSAVLYTAAKKQTEILLKEKEGE